MFGFSRRPEPNEGRYMIEVHAEELLKRFGLAKASISEGNFILTLWLDDAQPFVIDRSSEPGYTINQLKPFVHQYAEQVLGTEKYLSLLTDDELQRKANIAYLLERAAK